MLSIRNLTVRRAGAAAPLVDAISLEVGSAERVALVGESGSGKSLTARAVMGLLRLPLLVQADRLAFDGQDLRQCSPRDLRRLRGRDLAFIFQDPRFALNPVHRLRWQLEEMLVLHGRVPSGERRRRLLETIASVGLREQHLELYPQQLSGGMGQRAMLAMMLLNRPRLLIADEPTSALDAALRTQVLDGIRDAVVARHMGLLLISHDLHSVARYCDRVLVMFRGRIVDECAGSDLPRAQHPYTRTLWSCSPSGTTYGTRLPVLDRDEQERIPR